MDNFDLWTKQNINDIIFNFNEKNYELLRSFIKWYDIESNYMYILSTRYFYSNECLEVLLSTINAFIDVKNNDTSEEEVVNDVVNELHKEIDIIEREEVVVNELEKENDSDEYVINDHYYFKENIVKNEDEEEKIDGEVDIDEEKVDEEKVDEEKVDEEKVDEEKVGVEEVDGEEVVEEEVGDNVDEEDNNNLIINKFSNNEIILLLNILEEDTKKFRKHNYIIAKFKEKLFFYNNFYLGFTSGLLFYFFFKFL